MWHVWGIRETRTGFREGKLEERDHLGDIGVDWSIILKLSYITCMGGRVWTGYCGSGWGEVGSYYVLVNERSCFMKRGKFLDQKVEPTASEEVFCSVVLVY
jgi:hypothetical protein